MTSVPDEMCSCGRPLHYSAPWAREYVEQLVAEQGSHVAVTVGDRTWLVQRHYIALHGIKADELPDLGFEEITS